MIEDLIIQPARQSPYNRPVISAGYIQNAGLSWSTIFGSKLVSATLMDVYVNEKKSVSWFINRFDKAIRIIRENYTQPYRLSAIMDFFEEIRKIPCWVPEGILSITEESLKLAYPEGILKSESLTHFHHYSDGKIWVFEAVGCEGIGFFEFDGGKYIGYSTKNCYKCPDSESFYQSYLEFKALSPFQRSLKVASLLEEEEVIEDLLGRL